jgi:hypothetical protein
MDLLPRLEADLAILRVVHRFTGRGFKVNLDSRPSET